MVIVLPMIVACSPPGRFLYSFIAWVVPCRAPPGRARLPCPSSVLSTCGPSGQKMLVARTAMTILDRLRPWRKGDAAAGASSSALTDRRRLPRPVPADGPRHPTPALCAEQFYAYLLARRATRPPCSWTPCQAGGALRSLPEPSNSAEPHSMGSSTRPYSKNPPGRPGHHCAFGLDPGLFTLGPAYNPVTFQAHLPLWLPCVRTTRQRPAARPLAWRLVRSSSSTSAGAWTPPSRTRPSGSRQRQTMSL